MEPEDVCYASIRELQSLLTAGALSPSEIARTVVERIDSLQPRLNAFLSVNRDLVSQAGQIEQQSGSARDLLPLAGVTLSVKDLMPAQGLPTTAGSKVIGADIASRDALVVARLRAAGCLVIGKTNLHEFAYGVTTENEHFGAARNPWNRDHIAGGSSGGSAVALAAGLGHASIGTDTRGSIRIPSSCCATTGLKPTRGLLPLDDVIPLSPTLDHVGPMARSVEDVFMLLEVMAQHSFQPEALTSLRGGWCPYYFQDLEPGVEACARQAMDVCERIGIEWHEVAIPELAEALAASSVIASAESVAYHGPNLRDRPQDYGPLVRRRLEAGHRHTLAELSKALETAARIRDNFAAVFQQIDLLLAPVLPVPPPRLGALEADITSGRRSFVPSMVRFNAPQNVAGVPALSLPAGFSEGLPTGIQLVAAKGRESLLRSVGQAFQALTDWHLQRPRL